MADSDILWKVPADTQDGQGELAWVERDGRFAGVRDAQGYHAFADLDLEQFAPRRHKDGAACGHGDGTALFPADFSACPDCGGALEAMFPDRDELWSYPSPARDGLLDIEKIDIRRVEPAQVAATPGRNLTLIVAGRPRRLLALDRGDSNVYAFNRQTGAWRLIASDSEFNGELPAWSWSVLATDQGGFAFAGLDKPLVARLDALGTAVEIDQPAEDFGTPVSGPILLANRLLFLCADGKGGLCVVVHDPETRAWSKECDIPGAVHTPDMYFAAPALLLPNAYWAGLAGYVCVRRRASGFEVNWRSWTPGFRPELQIRPLLAGNLWQFGVLDGAPRFEGMTRQNEQLAQKDISGPYLTAGECAFSSGMTVSALPWDPNRAQTVGNNDSFLMPIMGLKGMDAVVADCGFNPSNRRVDPSELLDPAATPKPAQIRIYKQSGPALDLGTAIWVSNILQLQAAVFDGRLLVYDALGNNIYAWKFA